MDLIHGPDSWIGSMDQIHGSDPWIRSMDLIHWNPLSDPFGTPWEALGSPLGASTAKEEFEDKTSKLAKAFIKN